jgi:hypothetical protein
MDKAMLAVSDSAGERIRGTDSVYFDTLRSLEYWSEAANYFDICCWEFANKRTAFITKYGDVGTGPASVSRGDVIAEVLGVLMPLVLRYGEEARLKLVGPVFLHRRGLSNMVKPVEERYRTDEWEDIVIS